MDNEQNNSTKLFRQASIERISSPEELNDYVRVANPGVWMILIAVVILLAGFCVWGFMGQLETSVQGVLITEDGVTSCYVSENDISKVESGMTIVCDGSEYTVKDKTGTSFDAKDELSEYAMHVGGFSDGEWIHVLSVEGDNADNPEGTFAAKITVESVKPISFILN